VGHKSVEIADVTKIRRASPIKKSGYAPKLGTGSITLPLVVALTASSNPEPSAGPGVMSECSSQSPHICMYIVLRMGLEYTCM
jgi:hypothetical protein